MNNGSNRNLALFEGTVVTSETVFACAGSGCSEDFPGYLGLYDAKLLGRQRVPIR